jgi:soluble lytic murein transglycosylase
LYGEEIDGKAYIKKGRTELESSRYEDAISSLSIAEREFPLLGDYALLWISDAYHEIGNHEESLKTIRTLLKKYPYSPLRRKARIREIKEAEEVSEDVGQMFESYRKDYPDDTEMRYMYARWLKKEGKADMARSIFKEIYVDAGPFSEMAYNELDSSQISVEDLIERASNLMKVMDFKGAESVLKSAMAKTDGRVKNELLKSLGLSLFRQKRYREAAEIYKKATEKYWEVLSLYRAGEKEAFNSTLNELLKTGDKRAGSILITVASDMRRDGRIDEAIKMYQDIIEQYPSETEDAVWGIGWTYFLTGEYKKASEVFTKLYTNYNDTKYLYWKARSLEASGEDTSSIYHTLMKKERDFYNIMSYVRTKGSPEQLETEKLKTKNYELRTKNENITPVTGTPATAKKIDRIEALFELGFSKEALSELIYISKSAASIDDLLYIGSKFQELGEYKYILNLTLKVPYMEKLHHLWYPLAYRDIVEDLSGRYGIEPLLVVSVIREESRFDPEAKSSAGARGLMQVMPQTAYQLDNKLKLGISNTYQIYDVKNNLHLGVYYLSNLIKEFGSYTYALAAYNAGEEKVRRWIQKGNYKSIDEFIEDIPYTETKSYVKRVLTTFFEYKRMSPTPYPIDFI